MSNQDQAERRRVIAERFLKSYIFGQMESDAIKAVAELLEYCGNVEDVFHGMALYPVGSELTASEQEESFELHQAGHKPLVNRLFDPLLDQDDDGGESESAHEWVADHSE